MGTTDTEYWRKLRVGEVREMNCGDQAKILEYNNAFDIKIEFLDNYHYQTHCHYSNFQRGTVKNPYHPNKYGGVIGEGDNKISINQKMTKEYDAWIKMLARSKDEKYKQIETTYLDVDCCEEWMNFNTFADWFKENTIDYSGTKAVDKDWIKQGNKIYCPEYCAIVHLW